MPPTSDAEIARLQGAATTAAASADSRRAAAEARASQSRPAGGVAKKIIPKPKCKRPCEEEEEAEAARNAKKQALQSFIDTFKCPIGLKLFVDPVSMSDGFTYEKKEALKHMQSARDARRVLKSPMTNNNLLNGLLTPNPNLKSALENAVEAGLIEGELVDEWKAAKAQALADERKLAELQDKAYSKQDPDAWYEWGAAFLYGRYGLEVNVNQAQSRFEKGAQSNHPSCTAMFGFTQATRPSGNVYEGLASLGRAAGMGSKFACCTLAKWYTDGLKGLRVSNGMARRMYECASKAPIEDADAAQLATMDAWLAIDEGNPEEEAQEEEEEEEEEEESSEDEEVEADAGGE